MKQIVVPFLEARGQIVSRAAGSGRISPDTATIEMFDQLTGNERVKQLLRRMLGSGRVPGALSVYRGRGRWEKALCPGDSQSAQLSYSPRRQKDAANARRVCECLASIFPQSEDSDDWKKIIWTDHGDVGMVVAPKRVLQVEQMRQIEARGQLSTLRRQGAGIHRGRR